MNYFNDIRKLAAANGNDAALAAQVGNAHYAGLFARKAAHWGIEYLTALGRWKDSPQLFHNERSRHAKSQTDIGLIG